MTLLSSSVNAKLCSKFSLPQATQNTRRVESWFRFYVSEFLLFSVLNILLARVRLLLLTFVWTVNMLMAFISPSIASRQAAIREANRLRGRRSQFWLCFRGFNLPKGSHILARRCHYSQNATHFVHSEKKFESEKINLNSGIEPRLAAWHARTLPQSCRRLVGKLGKNDTRCNFGCTCYLCRRR